MARDTPIRSDFKRMESHTADTGGRVSSQRRHCRSPPASGWAIAPPHRVHWVNAPHWAQASNRMRPVRFRMHTTGAPPSSSAPRRARVSRSENRPVRGSSARRSTTSTNGQPRRSTGRGVVITSIPSDMATGGQGVTKATTARSRRPRSRRTSTADQVGARSSRYASSWASSTMAARSSGTGAQAADRVPTTTWRPVAARSHWSGITATGIPAPPQAEGQLVGPGMGRRQHHHPLGPHPVDQLQGHQRGVEGRGQPDHRASAGGGEDAVDQGHRAATGRRRPTGVGRSLAGRHRAARWRPGAIRPRGPGPPGSGRRSRGRRRAGRPTARRPTRPGPPRSAGAGPTRAGQGLGHHPVGSARRRPRPPRPPPGDRGDRCAPGCRHRLGRHAGGTE